MTEVSKPADRSSEGKQLAEELVERARNQGVELVGPGGLLSGLTKNVLEAGLEAEMSEHLGYDKHEPTGRKRATLATGPEPRRCSPPARIRHGVDRCISEVRHRCFTRR